MATVELTIAGRPFELACRDGEEAHLRMIAAMVDVKALDAAKAMGGMSEARQMLFAALLLADELNDTRAALTRAAAAPAPPAPPDPEIAARVERLAERVERLSRTIAAAVSDRVETPPASA
ncbi:cell division protein ZapA [Sphingomonas profundi]|uniref:cell division protein ZapA n=1 Tax=Alterirhizorhabdus profundi TaxID=2681549 RepID=UPI0012E91413|nr:cell division protein ZapA [Sphingomonas profundi]